MAQFDESNFHIHYGHYFYFFAQKDMSMTVKCKLQPEQKQLPHPANTTSDLYKHLQRYHASAKLAKNQA